MAFLTRIVRSMGLFKAEPAVTVNGLEQKVNSIATDTLKTIKQAQDAYDPSVKLRDKDVAPVTRARVSLDIDREDLQKSIHTFLSKVVQGPTYKHVHKSITDLKEVRSRIAMQDETLSRQITELERKNDNKGLTREEKVQLKELNSTRNVFRSINTQIQHKMRELFKLSYRDVEDGSLNQRYDLLALEVADIEEERKVVNRQLKETPQSYDEHMSYYMELSTKKRELSQKLLKVETDLHEGRFYWAKEKLKALAAPTIERNMENQGHAAHENGDGWVDNWVEVVKEIPAPKEAQNRSAQGLAKLNELETFRKIHPSEPYIDVLNSILIKADVLHYKPCAWDKEAVKEPADTELHRVEREMKALFKKTPRLEGGLNDNDVSNNILHGLENLKAVLARDAKYATLSELQDRMDHIERIQSIFKEPANQEELDIVMGLKHIYADVARARNVRLGEEEKKD